jgi:hypothetical protein
VGSGLEAQPHTSLTRVIKMDDADRIAMTFRIRIHRGLCGWLIEIQELVAPG